MTPTIEMVEIDPEEQARKAAEDRKRAREAREARNAAQKAPEDPTAGKSIGELSTLLLSSDILLDRLSNDIKAAYETFNRATAASKFKTEGERAAHIAEEMPKLTAAREQARKAALEIFERARSVENAVKDSIPALPAGDLQEANGKRAFVKEDCEEDSLPVLRDKIRAAVFSGDRVSQYLYLRYTPKRLETTSNGGAEVGEIHSLLRTISDHFKDSSLDPIREKATFMKSKALATMTQAGPTPEERANELRRSGDYGGRF